MAANGQSQSTSGNALVSSLVALAESGASKGGAAALAAERFNAAVAGSLNDADSSSSTSLAAAAAAAADDPAFLEAARRILLILSSGSEESRNALLSAVGLWLRSCSSSSSFRLAAALGPAVAATAGSPTSSSPSARKC